MHKLEIPDKKIILEFAEKVEELSPEQAIYFMEQMLLYQAGKFDIIEMKIRIVYKLLNMKQSWNYHLMLKEQKELVWTNIYRISETVESFFKEEDFEGTKRKVIDWETTKNLLPVIGKFYGPEDLLQNISFYEYKEANGAFLRYIKSKEESDLNELVAILYRPKKFLFNIRKLFPFFDGQIRQSFTAKTNPKYFEKRLKEISKLPFVTKYVVFMYMNNCENFMRTGKINIDGNEIDLSILYKSDNATTSNDAGIGLAGILFSLAETHVFGDIESTANTNIWTIIARLYQVKRDADQLKEKYNTQSNDQG